MNTEDFDLGLMRFSDYEIPCGSFKVSFKQEVDTISTTNSFDAVGYVRKKRSYEFEASDILPEFLLILKKIWVNNEKGTISTFNVLEDGSYQAGFVLNNAIITEFDSEQSEGNKVSLKGVALRLVE